MMVLISDALHLLEVYQGVIGARPLEMGNAEFLRCLLAASQRLGEALTAAPADPFIPRHEIEPLLTLLREQTPSDAKRLSGQALKAIAGLKSRRARLRGTPPLYLKGALPALSDDYAKVTVIFGPALGLGDQITFLQFLKSLAEHCRRAPITIFTLYPKLWTQILPGAREFHYRGKPLRPFSYLERGREDVGKGKRELVVVADFECFNLHRSLIPRAAGRDVLEVALGRRSAWLSRDGSAWVRVEEFYSESEFNNYRMLRSAADRLFPRATLKPAWQAQQTRRHDGRRKRRLIFLNPFSSKKFPLEPRDWHRLLLDIKAGLPAGIELHVVVYPGLDSSTEIFAREICRLCKQDERRIRASLLGEKDSPVTPFNALGKLIDALAAVDLCVTLDTFTAHLVPLFGIPSVVITLGENRAFWVPGRWSFYSLLDKFEREPHVLAVHLLSVGSRPEVQTPEFREAAERLLAVSDRGGVDGFTVQTINEIQGSLLNTLKYAGPTFPYLAQARQWLLLWSRLASAARREPEDLGGARQYLRHWRDSEFLKLLSLAYEG